MGGRPGRLPGAAERVGAGDVVEVTQDHMAQFMREGGVAA
jgi:hypothetical protein